MEVEIIAYKKMEEFALYQISQLINSDFGRNAQKSRVLTPTSPTRPPLVAISPIPSPSAPVLAYTPINPMQPLGIGSTPETYGTPAAFGIPASFTLDTAPTYGVYMQSSGLTFTAYIQSPGTGPPSTALEGTRAITANYI